MEQLNAILKERLGDDNIELYQKQLEVLEALINRSAWITFIAGTGRGKSEAYFLATYYLRNQNPRSGPVVVISPYLALINDQVFFHLNY